MRFLAKVFIFLVVAGLMSKFVTRNLAGRHADGDLPSKVAAMRATLPKMIEGVFELQDVSYDNRTIHYEMLSNRWFDKSTLQGAGFLQNVRNEYCTGKDKFALMNVSLDYNIRIPPQTLNDRMSNTHVELHPDDCR